MSCSLDCPCCCNLFALSRSFSTSDPPVVRLLGRRPWPLASESLTEVAVSKERHHIKKVKRELPKNKKISSQWPPGEGHTKTARTHRKTLKLHIEICQLKKTKTNKQNRKQKTTKSCRITILQAKIKIPTKPHKKIAQCCITANRYAPLHQVTTSKSPRLVEASNKL